MPSRHELGSTQPVSRADWSNGVLADAWNVWPVGSMRTVKRTAMPLKPALMGMFHSCCAQAPLGLRPMIGRTVNLSRRNDGVSSGFTTLTTCTPPF